MPPEVSPSSASMVTTVFAVDKKKNTITPSEMREITQALTRQTAQKITHGWGLQIPPEWVVTSPRRSTNA
jgi:hypothetical protein